MNTTTAVPRQKITTTTSIHVMALDGIVNVNSLFTLAVFLGLAFNPTDPNFTLLDAADSAACTAGSSVAEDFIAFHVYSFSSFLFSSLVASALKQAITISKNGGGEELGRSLSTAQVSRKVTRISKDSGGEEMRHSVSTAQVSRRVLRAGILASAAGSASGCVFLTLALIDLVQIKLGSLACCWSWHSLAAIGPLVMLVPSALIIYISVVLHAFTR